MRWDAKQKVSFDGCTGCTVTNSTVQMGCTVTNQELSKRKKFSGAGNSSPETN